MLTLPAAPSAGTTHLWISKGYRTRVIVRKNGSTVTTVGPVGTQLTATIINSVNVVAGDIISYELFTCPSSMNGGCYASAGYMATNLGQYRGTCGTGCPCNQGGNFGVGSVTAVFDFVKAAGQGDPINFLSGYSTYGTNATRQLNTVDTTVACLNDGVPDGVNDADFNDMQILATFKTSALPTDTPTPTITPTATSTATPTITATATPTHSPGDTGIAEDFLFYVGAILYGIGIVVFMGARVIDNDKTVRNAKIRIVL